MTITGFFSDFIRLIRIPSWGFFPLVPVIGALSASETRVLPLLVLFIIGIFQNIFTYVSNDVIDAELDKMSKLPQVLHTRPIAKGTISKKIGILLSVISVISIYLLSYMFFYRASFVFYFGILILTIGIALCTIYNIWGKRFKTSSIYSSIAEALVVIYAAYMVSDSFELSILTMILFVLIFNQTLYMGIIIGGIKDAGHDWKKNCKTIALACGVKVNEDTKQIYVPLNFKLFGIIIRAVSLIILFIPAMLFNVKYEYWQLGLLFITSVLIMYLSIKWVNIKYFDREKINKNIFSQISARFTANTMILFPLLDTSYIIIVILFPFVWFLIFFPIMIITKKHLPKPKNIKG